MDAVPAATNGYTFSGAVPGGQPYFYYGIGSALPFDVVINLDQVFTGMPASLPTDGPFAVAQAASPFAYTITAAKTSAVWNFASGQFDSNGLFRTAVRTGFDKLLSDLDALGLLPGRLQAIRGWIAQAIPQTIAESLYLRHGFDPVNRCVELSPGMRLRIDFQEHQAVDPGDDPRNGFVGSGSAFVEVIEVIGKSGGSVLGFGPFMSRLQGLSVAASSGGAGGTIDLQGAAYQLPYWRLFYPPTYPSSDGTGVIGIQQNVTLIGAPNRADLEAATTAYVAGQLLPSDAVTVWLRGRATVVPEIPVFLQNQHTYVPVGTTARDLLSGVMPLPRSQSTRVPQQTFLRPFNGLSSHWVALGYSQVPLGSQAPWSVTLDTFDLPLLAGDSLWIGIPSPGSITPT